MTVPPCALPPQLTTLGGTRNRIVTLGALDAAVYSCSSMSRLISARAGMRSSAASASLWSELDAGSHAGSERP